jgi:TolB-like protein
VLPLRNLSGDADQEYFADGMTEALITDLAPISALMVISRTSIMRFKDSDLSLPEIARELGVDAVLEGSVQREADRVRITTQLIDAATDRHLWADTFERALEGTLALQSEVARSIAGAIAVEVSPAEATRLAHAREVNPGTYEAYLRGMHHLRKGTPEGFQKGMAYLNEAVDIDPADPLAYAGLASGYVTLGHTPLATPRTSAGRRRQLAERWSWTIPRPRPRPPWPRSPCTSIGTGRPLKMPSAGLSS